MVSLRHSVSVSISYINAITELEVENGKQDSQPANK